MKKKLISSLVLASFACCSYSAFAGGFNATETGPNASAAGIEAVAVGSSAQAPGRWGTALGRHANAAGDVALAVGSESIATGDTSVAIGSAAKASATDSIALGQKAQASGAGSIAIGSYSIATSRMETPAEGGDATLGSNATGVSFSKNADTSSANWSSYQGQVLSVGGSITTGSGESAVVTTVNRQITGVAAGFEDNDAVNVAQLKDLKVYGDDTYATVSSLSNYATAESLKDYATTTSVTESLNNYATLDSMTDMSGKVTALETSMGALKDLTPETISALKNLTENGVFTVETPSGTTTVKFFSDSEGDSSVGGGNVPGVETPTNNKATVGLGSKLNFAGDSNIKTSLSQDEEGNVTVNVAMAEDATVNSLTANEITTGNLTVNQKLTANEIEAKTVTAETVTGANIVATNSLTAPSITFANGPTLSYNNETGRLQYVSNATAAAEGDAAVATNLATTKDGIKFGANEGESVLVNLEDNQVDIKGGDEFISTSIVSNGNGGATIEVKTTDALKLALGNGSLANGITIGAKDGYQEIRIQQGDVNMGGNRIQNIGDGVAPADAVNKRQLDNATNSLSKKIHDVDKDLRAGVAMAMAVAGLPQAYMPGKSILGVSAGTYHGQGGFALGLSHATENRAWVIKGAATVDTRGNFGGTIGAGYQF